MPESSVAFKEFLTCEAARADEGTLGGSSVSG
jgi:hypothetical protein